MFIQELCGSWIDHPFWRKSFTLKEEAMLEKLVSSQVKEVIIDSSKGLDVAADEPISAESLPLDLAQMNPHIPNVMTAPVIATPAPGFKATSIDQERERAKKILNNSKLAVSSMFKEVRMGQMLNAKNAIPVVEEITDSIYRNGGALISLARLKHKDDYTYLHSVAVCALMVALGRELGLTDDEIQSAGLGGLLHDIGKSTVSLDILNKPGKLTDEEFSEVKQHTSRGYAILLQADDIPAVTLDICLHHHEKIDGSGYPTGLKNDEISLFAKMGAVCDVYDAVTSSRPYKEAWQPGVALQRMAQWKMHFDEVVFKAFVKTIGIYPIGSMVMLKSGRLAAVIDQNDQSLLKPTVKIFFSVKSKSRIPVEMLDLAKPGCQDQILGHEDPAKWGIQNVHELWT